MKTAGVVLLAALAAVLARPVQSELKWRELRMSFSAKRLRSAGLTGFERDLCVAGEPCRCVALIHGLGDNALTWDKVMLGKGGAPAPPRGYRLVALNLPGTEDSDAPTSPAGYSAPRMAEAVAAALEPRCSSWTVAGNSLGGWVAAWTALRRPDLVSALVLVNPGGLEDKEGASIATVKTLARPTAEGIKEFAALAYHQVPPAPPWAWAAVAAQIAARPTGFMVAAMRTSDLLDSRAAKIRARTTVVWGDSDRAVSPSVGEGFARLIPGAALKKVPACGHLPQVECPQAVSSALFER